MIKRKLISMSLPLMMLFSLASCAWESEYGSSNSEGNIKEVVFSMRVPASYTVTRALTPADEFEIKTFDVLVFNAATQELLSRATHSGQPLISGQNFQFYVKLEHDTNIPRYDFILLANARDLITNKLYTGGVLNKGKSKIEVQKVLKESLTAGNSWIVNNADPNYKAIPMWGEMLNKEIQANYADNVELLRALVKVDLTVELASTDTFVMTDVHFYNYNTEGYLIPSKGYQTGVTEKEPSIENLTPEKTTPLVYTSHIASGGTSLTNSIYVFEARKGSITDYGNNPCILVKGNFNGTPGWYRLDFANVDAQLNSIYMPLVRQHCYKMSITAINGPGSSTEEGALNSKPCNITTSLTTWTDGGEMSGVWNGNHEINFDKRAVHFSQFANTSEVQTIKITSNVPTLSIGKFIDMSAGSTDGQWRLSGSNPTTYTNGHFTVSLAKTGTQGKLDVYEMKISSAEAVSGDPARLTTFSLKGSNLEAFIEITQDKHVVYQLITDPARNHVFVVDGNERRIPIDVASTHNYIVHWDSDGVGMLKGVYLSDTATDNMKGQEIDHTTYKTVYIALNKLEDGVGLRAGEFVIKHSDVNSNASPADFTVIQKKPVISASLVAGQSGELPREGGSVKIKVESNMNKWEPILLIDGSRETNDANIQKYFGLLSGSGNADVTFTVEELSGNVDKVFTITFKDANGDTKSTPEIIITQIAKLPGSGSGGQQPGSGMEAVPGIIAVNSKGQLNLNGDGHLVYFKYGSLIAMWSGENRDVFDVTDIAWTPDGFNYEMLIANIGTKQADVAWKFIPYAGDPLCNMSEKPGAGAVIEYEGYPDYPTDLPDNISKGLGDPCKYVYASNGKKYRTPKGGISLSLIEEYDVPPSGYMTSDDDAYGISGRWYNKGLPDAQFYPSGGVRVADYGRTDRPADSGSYFGGYFWCSRTENPKGLGTNRGGAMRFTYSQVYLNTMYHRAYGFLVRCTEDK